MSNLHRDDVIVTSRDTKQTRESFIYRSFLVLKILSGETLCPPPSHTPPLRATQAKKAHGESGYESVQ